MPTPNVIGYVTEFVEDRTVTVDPERNTLVPGPFRMNFKLKLKNTLGQEKIVWAILADPSLHQEVGDFYSAEIAGAQVVSSNRTVDELANQLAADLKGERDYHDKAMDALNESHNDRLNRG